jgi:hypothetical protein
LERFEGACLCGRGARPTCDPGRGIDAINLAREVCRKTRRTSAVSYLKALTAIGIFSITAVVAFAQDEQVDLAPKPTLADVRHLAEVITGEKSKLRAYCELGGIHDQMHQALDNQDASALDALIAKANALEQQIGPEYYEVIEGLEQIDFNTAEGEQIAYVFKAVQEKCE